MVKRTFMRAVDDAADGIAQTFREQRSFRIQVGVGVIAVLLGALLNFNAMRWSILALTIGIVLTAELMNTALERAVDTAAPGPSEIAKAAKHAGAGAVLAACIAALLVGVWLYGGALAER
jgi:undecaprenol kinase